jgi:hypothetical protein
MNPYTPPGVVESSVQAIPKSGMTTAAANQGIKNLVICAMPMLAALGFVYWLLTTFTASSHETALFSAFVIIFAVCLLGVLISWLRGIRLRGELLIDCGRHPARRLLLFNAIMFLVLGFGSPSFGTFGPVFAISFSAFWLSMATSRLAVYEAGLWVYQALIPWNKISHFSWTSGNTLMIRTTNKWALPRAAIPFPVECVDDVTRLLSQHNIQSKHSSGPRDVQP